MQRTIWDAPPSSRSVSFSHAWTLYSLRPEGRAQGQSRTGKLSFTSAGPSPVRACFLYRGSFSNIPKLISLSPSQVQKVRMPADRAPEEPPNGTLDGSGSKPKPTPVYDSTFTDRVIAATGPKAHPRVAEIMPSLIRHLHDFAREVDLSVAEWNAAIDFVRARPFFSITTLCVFLPS